MRVVAQTFKKTFHNELEYLCSTEHIHNLDFSIYLIVMSKYREISKKYPELKGDAKTVAYKIINENTSYSMAKLASIFFGETKQNLIYHLKKYKRLKSVNDKRIEKVDGFFRFLIGDSIKKKINT